MNNTGHALTTNDIEAIRKAQQEWRLQKRRELEAKARKKQFRLSSAAAAQSHQKFPQSPSAPSLATPTVITQPHTTAQSFYAHQVTSSPPTVPGPHHNPALYTANLSTSNPETGTSQESVAQQVLRQKAIQQQTQLHQMQQARQGVSSQQVPIQRLFQTTRELGQAPVIASATLITTSPGVSIQPQAPNQHPSARPVAPRPSVPNDINMKNAVAAAAAAANAASAAAVAMSTQLNGEAATAKATEEAAAAAAAAAHAAANVSAGDPQYAAMLPSNAASVAIAKSTQEAVDAAAAAAAAAASAAIPGSSVRGISPLDEATRIKLEQLEAQRRWREEKRRELALKRAKGASSKRGRKRTKFLHSSPTQQELVTNQSALPAAVTGISSPTAPITNPLSELAGSSVPFSTSVGSSVAVPGTQPLTMSSGAQSQITAVQLGVQGGFLAGSQPSVSQIPSGSTGMPTVSAAVVNEGHLTPEDAAAMYAQMARTGTGGGSLPMESSGPATLPLTSSGGALVGVEVVQGGPTEVGDPGLPDDEIPGANSNAAGADVAVEPAAEADASGDTTENEVAKATEAAAVEATGECEGAGTAQHTSMVDEDHATGAGEEGIETTGAEEASGAAQQSLGGNGTAAERAQEPMGQELVISGRRQEHVKDTTDTSEVHVPANLEVSEIADDEDIKAKESGNEGAKEHQDGIIGTADGNPHGVSDVGETDANEDSHVARDSVGGTEAKEDDEGPQDRFQEDGGEDIMTAAAWQSLDSINP